MRSRSLRTIAPGLLVALAIALGLAACGSSSSSSSSGSVSAAVSKYAPPTSAPSNACCAAQAGKGGTLTMLWAGDVDYIDPGAAYYQPSYSVDLAVDRPLMSWPPAATKPAPDLAAGQPKISSDGKTITFTIKKGIRYSPPTGGGPGWNKPVVSADVKYAMERGLIPGVPNGYALLYFNDLVGFKQAQAAAKADPTKVPNISGIQTPNPTTVVFKLTKPSSLGFIQALSLPLSSPVPEGYAAKYDSATPSSTYGQHQLDAGPYYIATYKPGTEILLKRNPNWNPKLDFRPAYLNEIDIQEGFSDTASAGRKILTGSDQVNGDFSALPETVKLAATKYPAQMTLTPAGANRYVAFNTTKPPFNNINVRKAAIAASNRDALRATRGGPLIGAIATHYMPPGIDGFEQAGGYKGPSGPQFDFMQHSTGDMAIAKKYMKKAGFSSGKCEGAHCTITMVGDNTPPGSDTSQVVKSQLTALGFNVQLHPVDHDVMYTKFCSVPANQPNVCPNVGWIKDFNTGQGMIDVPFNGASINPSNNSNWPQLNDPAINHALDQAKLITDPKKQADEYGKIDQMITAQAVTIPWLWDNEANISSKDVAVVINQFNALTDLSYTSLKNQ
jgi:peptide/nickel transport system substrate-binding protein